MVKFHIKLFIKGIIELSLQFSFSVASKFQKTDFSLKKQVYADFYHCLKVFLEIFGGSWGKELKHLKAYIIWYKGLLLEVSELV